MHFCPLKKEKKEKEKPPKFHKINVDENKYAFNLFLDLLISHTLTEFRNYHSVFDYLSLYSLSKLQLYLHLKEQQSVGGFKLIYYHIIKN